jgi:recombination protein RecT
MNTNQVATREPDALATLRTDLAKMEEQFKFALPPHIPPARFTRVVMTAIQNNPKLLKCTRRSLFNACMRAAQDGLLPDGREGAIVPYGDDGDGGSKSDQAQWMPMIYGLRKKVRNSGLLRDWNVQVVQQGDIFDYQLGDRPYINHKPAPSGGRTRPVLFAYSIATYPDGSLSREVMNIDQIKDIQSKSKAKRGPWSDPIFFPEMCRKTVARLHAKQLPQSTDLDTLFRRDDALYDFDAERKRAEAQRPPPSIGAALDTFAMGAEIEEAPIEQEQQQTVPATGAASAGTEAVQEAATAAPAPPDEIKAAHQRGVEWRANNGARKALPPEFRDPHRTREALAWQAGFDGSPVPTFPAEEPQK